MSTKQRRRGAHLPSLDLARTAAGERQALHAEVAKRLRKGQDARKVAENLINRLARKHAR